VKGVLVVVSGQALPDNPLRETAVPAEPPWSRTSSVSFINHTATKVGQQPGERFCRDSRRLLAEWFSNECPRGRPQFDPPASPNAPPCQSWMKTATPLLEASRRASKASFGPKPSVTFSSSP